MDHGCRTVNNVNTPLWLNHINRDQLSDLLNSMPISMSILNDWGAFLRVAKPDISILSMFNHALAYTCIT